MKRVLVLALVILAIAGPIQAGPRISWQPSEGVSLRSGEVVARFAAEALFRFGTNESWSSFPQPVVSRRGGGEWSLSFELSAPDGTIVRVERRLRERKDSFGRVLQDTVTLAPRTTLTNDLEIQVMFSIADTKLAGVEPFAFDPPLVFWPLKNGWARSQSLAQTPVEAEYRLGSFVGGEQSSELALPLAMLAAGPLVAGVFADPMFSALFSAGRDRERMSGGIRFRYAASRVPMQAPETRTFAVWLPNASQGRNFPGVVDAWFRVMLPEVPPGPRWLHDIAMVDYDFLSDDGQGWERDLTALAQWLTRSERRRVALCLHGWYDALGMYAFDAPANRMKNEWVAFARTRKVRFTQDELRRRLRLAHDLGFRVLLYFGDGLAMDSGVAGFREEWVYRDAQGKKITGWQGPDTFGTTYLLNPAHPEVFAHFTNYLGALLRTFGKDTDGFVWDETFHAYTGQISGDPRAPGYCDRAMFALVKQLRLQVRAFHSRKVFLASDCIGVPGLGDIPGYAMVADGTYQDSHCKPVAWSYGLFPNWRNTLWSCNWAAMSNFDFTRWGVENFGVPVAISNGWGDDRGPSEWTQRQREEVLKLFRERLKSNQRVKFFTEDPARLLGTAPAKPGH